MENFAQHAAELDRMYRQSEARRKEEEHERQRTEWAAKLRRGEEIRRTLGATREFQTIYLNMGSYWYNEMNDTLYHFEGDVIHPMSVEEETGIRVHYNLPHKAKSTQTDVELALNLS